MSYHSTIPAEPESLQALSRAVYNFTCFEWSVLWTIVKLSSDDFDSVPKGKSAREIARALTSAIDRTTPPLSEALRKQLVKIDESYRAAIKRRNKLFHAHPFTAKAGNQLLAGGGVEWPMAELDSAAKMFEEAATASNGVFHGPPKMERP